MFNFVAVFFLIVNGIPNTEPAAVMPHKKTFPTEAACMAFAKTDEGKASMAALDVGDKPLIVRFGCQQAEDNSI